MPNIPSFDSLLKTVHGKTPVSSDRLKAIYAGCVEVLKGVPGAAAEAGVYRGGTAHVIGKVLSDRDLYLFDTFTGIPDKCDIDLHNVGDFSDTSLELVKSIVDRDAKYKIGRFPDTIDDEAKNETYALVHLDMDQYGATKDALAFFWPRLSPGGFIFLDDFEWKNCPGIYLAVHQFQGKHPEAVFKLSANYQACLSKPI